jgi:uncharacterized protein with HEPN domain
MRPEDAVAGLLWDMREAARDVSEIVAGSTYEQFLLNRTTRLAIERGLEILGEAARRVSAQFKATHPEVPWQEMIGQRNVLAHDYGDINGAKLWETAVDDLPVLIQQLDGLIPPLPPTDSP